MTNIICYFLYLCGFILAEKIVIKEKCENEDSFYTFSIAENLFGLIVGFLPAIFIKNIYINFLLGLLVCQMFIDIKYKELSDRITLCALISYLIFIFLAMDISRWRQIILATIVCFSLYFILYTLSRGSKMGGGDVKISFIMGLVGQYNLLRALTFPFIIFIIYFVITGIFKRGKSTKREFFPSILISFVILSAYYQM